MQFMKALLVKIRMMIGRSGIDTYTHTIVASNFKSTFLGWTKTTGSWRLLFVLESILKTFFFAGPSWRHYSACCYLQCKLYHPMCVSIVYTTKCLHLTLWRITSATILCRWFFRKGVVTDYMYIYIQAKSFVSSITKEISKLNKNDHFLNNDSIHDLINRWISFVMYWFVNINSLKSKSELEIPANGGINIC